MPSEFSIQPFQTQEEARAYRENMPIAMRSTVRGPVQGIASLSGMADIPAYLKRMAPPRLGGMGLGPKFWAPESEYKGYGEARQEYVENIGEAMVPGEAVAGGVHGSQLLTELAGIGVIGKQAIDLIRKYGPLAVTKIKSIFARKPGATVDDAVKEALEVSRRDVLKAGGAGIAALAVPGAAWKLGTAATKAAPVASTAVAKFAKLMSTDDLVTGPYFTQVGDSSPKMIGKLIDKDWNLTKQGKKLDQVTQKVRKDALNLSDKELDQAANWITKDLGIGSELIPVDPPLLNQAGKDFLHKYGLNPEDFTTFGGRRGLERGGKHPIDEWGASAEEFFDVGSGKIVDSTTVRKYELSNAEEWPDELIPRQEMFYQKIMDSPKTKFMGEPTKPSVSGMVDVDFVNIKYFEHDGIPIVMFESKLETWAVSPGSGKIQGFLVPNAKGLAKISDGSANKIIQEGINPGEISGWEKIEDVYRHDIGDKTKRTIAEISKLKEKHLKKKAHGGFIDKAITGGSKDI